MTFHLGKNRLRLAIPLLTPAVFLMMFSPRLFASYGQMKLCRGAWECGILSSLFFGLFLIPVAVVAAVLIFGKLNPQVPPARKRWLGLVIGVVSYFIAMFLAALMSDLVRVPVDYRFMANVGWFLLFQITLIIVACKMPGKL